MTKKKKKEFPPPKFVYTPPPKFKTKQEEIAWLTEEKRRWKSGHNGLTGPHYFYLTQFFIKVGTGQEVERPIWRDCDQYIFEEIDKAMAAGEDLLWISRREIGKSSIIACMAVWTMCVFTGSTSVLTSSNKEKINSIFSDKIYDILDGDYMHPAVKGTKVQYSNSQNKMFLRMQHKVLKNGKIEKRGSQLICVETSDGPKSPTNISSKRAKFIAIDEIGLHERRKDVLASSEDAMTEGGKRTGFRMLAGTIESKISASSVAELQSLVREADKLKVRVVFTPYWAGVNLVNGHSDKETSEKEWKEVHDRLASAEDKAPLQAFLKNRPPDIETALSVGGLSILPPEVMAAVNQQETIIRNNPKPVQKGVIIPDTTKPNGYDFVLNAEGSWFVVEHPIPTETYISGMDPIPFNTDNTNEKSSRYVTVIMKKSNKQIVAINKDRSADPDEIYRRIRNGLIYYNNAVSMLETNAGRTMYDRFKSDNKRELLARTPLRVPLKTKGIDDYGFWKAGASNVDDYFTEALIKYLLENSGTIWFDTEECSIIREIPFYLVNNTDIISALLACLLYLDELERKSLVKQHQKKKFKEIKVLVQGPNGMTPKYIKVPIHGNQQ